MSVQGVQVMVELGHKAWYRKKATPDKTHDWIMFVRGAEGNDISHFVEKIVFHLHESFNPPKRVVKSPPYELHESGYGEFFLSIEVYFRNKGEKGAPRKVSFQYFLNLNREDSPPINNVRAEKIKFYCPANEFLEKVLKSGGVIIGSDGHPVPSKIRTSSAMEMFAHNTFDASDFSADVDSSVKSSSHRDRLPHLNKKKRSSEHIPMSNDSLSSNDSMSKGSSVSDRSDRGKRALETQLFAASDEEDSKKKRKERTLEKADPGKRSGKMIAHDKKVQKTEQVAEGKHRTSKEDGRKHSDSKSDHKQDGSGREHQDKASHSQSQGHSRGQSSSKHKFVDSSSSSSSQTPQTTPCKNVDKVKPSESSVSRVHGSSHGRSSQHHRNSASGSHHHHSSKSSSSKNSNSSHSDEQIPKSQLTNHNLSKHSNSNSSDIKTKNLISSDIQIRLSPMEIQMDMISSKASISNKSAGKQDANCNKISLSADISSGFKPTQPSPTKNRSKNTTNPSSINLVPLPSDALTKHSDSLQAASKYDKLLDDMKSDDDGDDDDNDDDNDEEEEGEIRSPLATEVEAFKQDSSERKEATDKPKESGSTDRKKSGRPSSSLAVRNEKTDSLKLSPSKLKSEHTSTLPLDVVEDSTDTSHSDMHGKTKPKVKENTDINSKSSLPKKKSESKTQNGKDSSGRKATERSSKHKELGTNDTLSVKMAETDDKGSLGLHIFDQCDVKNQDDSDLRKENKWPALEEAYCDRAPNGEFLTSLVMIKQKVNDLTDLNLLQRIVDVIEESGKFKLDDENFEFDLCELDADTVHKVKDLLEQESDFSSF